MSLLFEFREWDISLPNPEFYCIEDSNEINFASENYLDALWFINMHEYAHVLYGHTSTTTDGEPKSTDQLRKDEIEADQFALRFCKYYLDDTPIEGKEDRLVSFVTGLLALLMSKKELDTPGYPHIHIRVIAALKTLSWKDTNMAWGVCAIMFKNWALTYGYEELEVRTHYKNDKHYCIHIASVIQSTIQRNKS